MREYDDAVLECFLDKQLQLFPEAVAETLDEAEDFLEECMAVVVDSVEDVIEYFDEAGMDVDGAVDDEILEADAVHISFTASTIYGDEEVEEVLTDG